MEYESRVAGSLMRNLSEGADIEIMGSTSMSSMSLGIDREWTAGKPVKAERALSTPGNGSRSVSKYWSVLGSLTLSEEKPESRNTAESLWYRSNVHVRELIVKRSGTLGQTLQSESPFFLQACRSYRY